MDCHFPEGLSTSDKTQELSELPDARSPLSNCPDQVPCDVRPLKPRVSTSVLHSWTPHSNCHSCPPRPCPGLLCPRTHHARHSFPSPLHLHTRVWSPGLPYPCRPAASRFTRARQTLLRSAGLAIQLPAPHPHITYACRRTPWASAHAGQKPSPGLQ